MGKCSQATAMAPTLKTPPPPLQELQQLPSKCPPSAKPSGGDADPKDLRHQHLEGALAIADSRRHQRIRGHKRGSSTMACSSRRGSTAPILVGGGPCATVSAGPGMAVREAARRVAVGNAEPSPAEPRAAVGGFSGVHGTTGRSSRLWRRRRCSKLRIGDDAACRGRSTCRDGRRRSAPASPQSGRGEGRCRRSGAGSTSIAMGPAQLEGPATSGAGVKRQPWRTRPRSVLGALIRRRGRRGHSSIAGATTTSTTSTDPHPEPPTPSPAFTGPAFAEKVAESVEEFVADVVVVVRDPHVDGAVENHVDKIDEEHRRRYVAKHRHEHRDSSKC
ncbi:hypothetical protein BDA96_02G122100 [Sorghum bicolor]|uniref:Uncharacterized protein n=1 Tax=Sorghum bicolor TaxID=4558 RepID=A0A921RLI2_SORBI|nr:hypothetical protein BDA96_02G122100 [Sorghum bicolor]